MLKVLISDKLSDAAVKIFENNNISVDFYPEMGKNKDELKKIIGNYDGLAIRSNTKVTADLLEKVSKLRVIGRAGIGVDNVDLSEASSKGIVVMNTPFGNSITTAEHTIAMILALARQIPAANASTHEGKWEKTKFMGLEITGKILGLIGAGNIGSVVASRALGLKMRVVAYDPFLSQERAEKLGIQKFETLQEVLTISDFISLHLPKTEKTSNIISSNELACMKVGSKLIN